MQLLHYRSAVANFGDDLNGVLWPALRPGLIDDDPASAFVGIGTIIGMPCDPALKLHVFSSGAGNDPVENWRGRDVTYWCVRGPISCGLLGLSADVALTDGAILTPLAEGFPRAATPGGATLVIPHFQTLDYPGWPEAVAQSGFELLDPRAEPRQVISRIASARLVLTESLHGAILADTYGIPWRVFATSGNFGSTKFIDWCLSLDIPFDLTYVPPPNALQILQRGKGPCVWGKSVRFTRENASSGFDARMAPKVARPPGLRDRIKGQIEKTPLLQPLLGYAPARTASALVRLAEGAPQLSAPAVRQRLQERMMARLAEVGDTNSRNS
jgi:succinoglycan biosynthesis protein ExoV